MRMEAKAPITLANIWAFLSGNARYWLYYSRLKWLIRPHIRAQIDFRIAVMDRECYNRGSCRLCGCRTTHLQMASKSCDKPCYPPFLSKRSWRVFYYSGVPISVGGNTWGLSHRRVLEQGELQTRFELLLNGRKVE